MSEPDDAVIYPPGWEFAGGQWVAVPLSMLQASGKVFACLECGSVVPPDLTEVHDKFHAQLGG